MTVELNKMVQYVVLSVLKSSPVQSFCLFGVQLDLDQSLDSQNLLQLQLQLIKTGNCSCNQLHSQLQLYYGLIMGLSNLFN